MGAAQSSNTAEAVAKVANSVSSNTTTTNNQITSMTNIVKLKNCAISGNVNIRMVAQFAAINNQVVQAMQNTHIQNSIAQQMQQLAQSTVGSLGLGFADASNYVSTYASASTDIANYVFTVSNQASFNDTSVTCSNSVIHGDFNINLSYTTSFWNDQGVKSQQINDIANTITQTVTQKAVAKVEGLAGILIILAILIAIIGYAISKPTGKALKALGPASAMIAVVIVVFLTVFMYVKATPPFFSEQQTCSPTGNLGGSKCSFDQCLNANLQTKSINKPPLKYMYNIVGKTSFENENVQSVRVEDLGMLNMVVYSSSNSSNYQFNQGYNGLSCKQWAADISSVDALATKWNKDTTFQNYGVPQLPNPFIIASTTNKDGDKVYCLTPKSYNYNGSVDPDKDAEDSNTPNVYTCSSKLDDDSYIKPDDLEKILKDKSKELNLLGVTAQLNVYGWNDYFDVRDGQLFGDTLEKQKLKRALHARYILTLASGLDNNIYIYDGSGKFESGEAYPAEEVSYMNSTILSSTDEAKNYCYKYKPDGHPEGGVYDYTKLLPPSTTGTLTGNIGVCNTRQNKLNHFFSNIGNWLLLIFGIIILVVLMYVFIRKIIHRNRE